MTGQELKLLRQKYNLTQKEVAEAIGTNYNRISEWELGKFKISKAYQLLLEAYFKKLG
jgi:transcriptional regulator with XRE-family HTH domain